MGGIPARIVANIFLRRGLDKFECDVTASKVEMSRFGLWRLLAQRPYGD
jgi:hypothetical protein